MDGEQNKARGDPPARTNAVVGALARDAESENRSTRDGNLGPQSLEALRDLITSGTLLPGQPIRQAEAATRLHVSRIPIRDALNSLVAEGMVQYRPNSGYHVAKRTFSELHQIYRMRRMLETEIIWSIDSFSKQAISAMERTNRKIEAAARAADMPTFSRLNREFHFIPLRQSHLNLMVNEIERLWNLSASYIRLQNYTATERHELVGEHRDLIEAMQTGDQDQVIHQLDRHRSTGLALLIDAFAGGNHPLIAEAP